jgi:hypothetical protein
MLRAIIEDVYAKSLAKLATSIYGDQEEGWAILSIYKFDES